MRKTQRSAFADNPTTKFRTMTNIDVAHERRASQWEGHAMGRGGRSVTVPRERAFRPILPARMVPGPGWAHHRRAPESVELYCDFRLFLG